jgi:hypothetical protein
MCQLVPVAREVICIQPLAPVSEVITNTIPCADKIAHVCSQCQPLGQGADMSVLVSSAARFGAEARLTFENAVCKPVFT